MRAFRCPACEQLTIDARTKWGASSFDPASCPACDARVYISGTQSSLWRTLEAFLVTLIVVRAFMGFSWSLVLLGVLVIVVMETLRLFLAPLVRLERAGG